MGLSVTMDSNGSIETLAKSMKAAVLIPARKNSKRVPLKNRLKVDGEFMISMVANELVKLDVVSDVFLSTDDEVLANSLSNQLRILSRSENLTDDYSTVIDVVSYHQENELQEYDLIIQAFVHSISVTTKNYGEAITKLLESDSYRLMSVCRVPAPVEWTYSWKGSEFTPNYPGKELVRSQDLPASYFDAGQFYIYKKDWFIEKDILKIEPYELHILQTMDLDEPDDEESVIACYKTSKLLGIGR